MRILAFDTCFDAVSAAAGLRERSGVWHIAERFQSIGKGHAEMLLPMVRDVMGEAHFTYADIDLIAVTNGPGGFTGLRAGLAAARGLALACGKPVVAMGSLELLARAVARTTLATTQRTDMPLVVAVDARKGDVFFQVFKTPAEPIARDVPRLVSIEEAARLLPSAACTIAGSAAIGVAAAAGDRRNIHVVAPLSAHARDLVTAAEGLRATGPVKPVYLRPPDAKPQVAAPIARIGT